MPATVAACSPSPFRGGLALALAYALVAGCATRPDDVGDSGAAALHAMMAGQFDSRAQALADDDYFAISLVMAPIFPEATDGHWLYVEQAMAEQADQPYRQRAYRLRALADGRVASDVFELDHPEAFVNGHLDGRLARLSVESLRQREGCTVFLRRTTEGFAGGTEGRGCASELRGAAYATAEVVISEGLMQSWDRGFSAADEQVWGAQKGAYRFVRRDQPR
jgi:hypothetical protein